MAMANGQDVVKNHADYVTASNDDDGVVKALKHFKLSSFTCKKPLQRTLDVLCSGFSPFKSVHIGNFQTPRCIIGFRQS
ncbi:hydrolase of the HAD superfamily protein [Lacticaseibacillus rhamnosus MTCC 5462]|nr:hydrolase of the HAD superfamily protein [Lacticaseibacillus rhamnosus MTCC 5462]